MLVRKWRPCPCRCLSGRSSDGDLDVGEPCGCRSCWLQAGMLLLRVRQEHAGVRRARPSAKLQSGCAATGGHGEGDEESIDLDLIAFGKGRFGVLCKIRRNKSFVFAM
jgi:hypothetical protein